MVDLIAFKLDKREFLGYVSWRYVLLFILQMRLTGEGELFYVSIV